MQTSPEGRAIRESTKGVAMIENAFQEYVPPGKDKSKKGRKDLEA